jgi:glycosyltransferase involved in cell wall biosynthesis
MIKIIHFHNGTGGGVLSVIRNLLYYRQNREIENHVIYTINKEQTPYFEMPHLEGAISEHVFYYSPNWNFFYTCKKLAELLPNDKAIIVAHDWLELGMVSNLGLQNPVVQYVHGAYEYYYDLAVKHSPWVDCYIAVAKHIKNELVNKLPQRKSEIYYLRFPVPDIKNDTEFKNPGFNIVFAARCEESKGYHLLPKIEKELQRREVNVTWNIAGKGSTDETLQKIWQNSSKVIFYGELSQLDLRKLFCKSHLFILPSSAEGMPITVIEAMKAGLIPLVNDMQCGLKELVINDFTGYCIKNNDIFQYADLIEKFSKSGYLVDQLVVNTKKHAFELFNPEINTDLIETTFIKLKSIQKKQSKKEYGSFLDEKYVPNFITFGLRKALKVIKSII